MEEKPKYQGRGGYRGGGRPKGRTQKEKKFRIDDDLCEYLETKVGNQDAFINMLIQSYKDKANRLVEKIDNLKIEENGI